MATYKCVTLTGLVLQFLAVVPPALLMWRPEQAKFSNEYGTVTGIFDILSKREKRLLRLALILALAGTAFQFVGLLLGP